MTLAHPGPGNLQASIAQVVAAKSRQAAGDIAGAAQAYQRAIQLSPLNGSAYYELMALLLQLGDIANADHVCQAIPAALYDKTPGLRHLHGLVLIEQGRTAEAMVLLQSLEGASGISAPHLQNDLGTCCNRQERHAEALVHYRKAYDTGLRNVVVYKNLAGVLQKTGDMAGAEHLYREALKVFPQDADLTYEYAQLLLKTEQYERGFQLYARRWEARLFGCPAPQLPIPRWNGRKPPRSLLVLGEQGLGDQILYSSLLPALQEKAGRVSVYFEPRLAPLLQRSFPGIEIANGIETESADALRAAYDAYLSAADIGALLPGAIGWAKGYLKPDPVRSESLRQKYRERFPGKTLVGISWKSQRAVFGEKKSVGIEHWAPVLARPDCQFISLQYGDVRGDVEAARTLCEGGLFVDPDVDSFGDIDGLAAQIAALDLVITTSNTTAHVAAAIDAPTWLVLPAGTGLFWYWGLRPDRIAWYPHVRPFRVDRPDHWAPTMAAVASALSSFREHSNDNNP